MACLKRLIVVCIHFLVYFSIFDYWLVEEGKLRNAMIIVPKEREGGLVESLS
jgi:hypothetical protein